MTENDVRNIATNVARREICQHEHVDPEYRLRERLGYLRQTHPYIPPLRDLSPADRAVMSAAIDLLQYWGGVAFRAQQDADNPDTGA